MIFFKGAIHALLQKFGYRLVNIKYNVPKKESNAFEDMQRLVSDKVTPTIFDIGANAGQTIQHFLDSFPNSEIYSFEPGLESFAKISSIYNAKANVHVENKAVGSAVEKKIFLENEFSDMSSFLEIDRTGWGKVTRETLTDVITIDHYCQSKNITRIDVLKSDTQGFELEVFKGAAEMMRSNKIGMVYFEFTFSDMYKNLPDFHEIFKLLTDNNFRLVDIYDRHYQEGKLSWADLLFINNDFTNQ